MKAMLVAIGLFVVGFGGVAVFGVGLPAGILDRPDSKKARGSAEGTQPATLGYYGDAVEAAYETMLVACTAADRKAYGRAMNELAVAKRHADTGKIERGNIGDRAQNLTDQFIEAVRKGVITNDHVPFGSLRTIVKTINKTANKTANKTGPVEKPSLQPSAFVLRGSIGESGQAELNECQVL